MAKKKSAAQLDREIEAFLKNRQRPDMPHAIPDRGYMVAQHGGGTYLSSFGSKDEAARFARGLAKQTRESYDIVKVQNRGEDRFVIDEIAYRTQKGMRPADTLVRGPSRHSTVKDTLSADELKALRTFADANGRSWKSKLNHAWYTGRYDDYNGTDDYGTLQWIRNKFGPSWLVRFSFDRPKTHSAKE